MRDISISIANTAGGAPLRHCQLENRPPEGGGRPSWVTFSRERRCLRGMERLEVEVGGGVEPHAELDEEHRPIAADAIS